MLGAGQDTVASPAKPVNATVGCDGASGGPGMRDPEESLEAEVPTGPVAVTVNVYDVPLAK
jgi:hypothetical protein